MKKRIAMAMCVVLLVGITGCTSKEKVTEKFTTTESTKEDTTEVTEAVNTETEPEEEVMIDPESERGVTLGIVSEEYLKEANEWATTADLEDMVSSILTLKGADIGVVDEWQKTATGTDRTVRNSDVAKAAYYAAKLLTEDGIPKNNANDNAGSGRWLPGDWHKDPHSIDWDNFIMHDGSGFAFYNRESGYRGEDPIVENEMNSTTAVMFAAGLASHYSGQYVLPQDEETGTLLLETELTREELTLRMVRLYDSFEPEAEYIPISSLGEVNVIAEEDIAKAAAVPEVDNTGSSDEWIGSTLNNYCSMLYDGSDGSLNYAQLTWNYREADFAVAADMGINYLRLSFTLPSLTYPAYEADRTKVNREIMEELDDTVRWGLKYGIHISFCFQGYLDDDIDGIGSDEGEHTPDYMASAESYEKKAELLRAFAQRYSNVPAKYLSFELQNENITNPGTKGKNVLTNEEMADKFIMLAEAVWTVTPDRGVSLSTDMYDLSEEEYDYWNKIASAGINLDFHCYEPRSFMAPREENYVDASQMIWPGFVDENGEEWDIDKVYDTYIAPWKELAEQNSVGFKIGECEPFVESWDLFDTAPREQKTMVAWANDFSGKLQENHVSYVMNHATDGFSPVQDVLPAESDMHAYMVNAEYTLKTYYLQNYTCKLYVNEEYAKACYGKK